MKSKMKSKIISMLLAVTVLMASLGFPSTVQAKTNAWSSRPIPVYADTQLSNTEKSQLREAINAWNSTRFGTFFVYSGEKSYVDIISTNNIIGVTKFAIPTTGNKSDDIANTRLSVYTNSNVPAKAIITLNTNFTFNSGGASSGTYYLKSVFMHELFHAIGFENSDHSINTSSVFCSQYTGSTTFQNSDLALIDELY